MIDDFEKLKRQVEDITRRREQAVGMRIQLLKRLKREFGLDSLEDAVQELEEAKEEERATARRYAKRKEAFEKEFKDKLKELESES